MNTPNGGQTSPLSAPRKKLPVRPSLEHLQKQAKRRVKTQPSLKLAEAQHQLAQEYGCKNWAELARMVETMLRGADQLANVKREVEPLPQAARAVDHETVQRLLEEGDFTQHDLDAALAHALWYGDDSNWPARKALADVLIAHGADPDGQYGSGYGPIVFGTAECLEPNGLQYLIDAGADITFPPVQTKYGMACVYSHTGTYVRGRNARKHRYIDLLLAHKAFIPPEVTPPILAIHRGDARGLGQLLDREPGLISRRFPDMPYGNISLRGATLLHCAVEFGEIECAEELFKRHADINMKADVIDGIGGQTPVFHAINTNCDGNFSMLEYLVKRVGQWMDMSVRATWNSYGEPQPKPMTPLEYATSGATEESRKWRSKIDEELAILRTLDHGEQIKAALLKEDAPTVSRLLNERPDLLTPALWPIAIFQARSLAMTRLLLARGLDPNACSAPRKPLHFAVDRGLPDVLKELLAAGADPNIKDGEGFAPLDLYGGLATNDPDTRETIIALLKGAGAEVNVWTSLRLGESETALQKMETNPELIHTPSPDLGFLPLQVAARMGDAKVVQWLIAHGADVNAGENTPLWFACQSGLSAEGRLEVARLLLAAGADPNRRCENGSTALHFAAWRGPAAMVELLLLKGARSWIADDKEKTPADYAKDDSIAADKEEIIRLFSEVRILDAVFRSAVAAIDAGDVERMKELLEKHPDLIHQRAEEEGWFAGVYFRHPTLLHFVANNPYRHETMPPRILESTEAILDAGADINAETSAENPHTVLGLVTSCEPARNAGLQIPLIDLLVRRGADPSRGLDPAIIHGEMEAVTRLLSLAAKHTLMSAAAFGEARILRDLIATSPAADTLENAAFAAVMHGQIPALEILVDAGVDIRKRKTSHPYAITLLHEAARTGHRALAEWLVARGADVTIRDSQFNGTPAGWAEHNGQPELAEWLRELETKASHDIDQKIVEAVRAGNLPVLQELLNAHPEKLTVTGGPWNKPLLHNAAWEGHLEIVRELVGRGADVNARCESDHACAIHFAAEPGHLDIVRFLAEAGSVIEAADNDHQLNVLGWATSLGSYREEVARFLLSRGAKMSIWSAVALNEESAVRELLAADPELVNAKMSRNEYFRSPLHHAVSRNRLAMVRLLLELGADPEVRDATGLSVVGAGNADTDPEILALLEATMKTPNLHDALTLGRFDRAAEMLAADPDCIKPGGSETRLFVYAVCRKNWPAAEWLLERGADINAIAEVYQCPATALHFAIECAPLERVKWLLDQGADTTIPDGTHHADALGWAEFFGKPDLVKMIQHQRGKTSENPLAPWLTLLEKVATDLSPDLRQNHQLTCKTGVWLNSAVLKLQKDTWTDGAGHEAFFSVWLDGNDLKKGRFNYNIHALKLRLLEGRTISSGEFASAFRVKFAPHASLWPNLRTDYGPQTLMQGWLPLTPVTFQTDVARLVEGFVAIHGILDELLRERRRP